MWSLLNALQIVSFAPLMDVRPPGFVTVFFEKINFVNAKIFLRSDELAGKHRFIRTFEDWNKNFSIFSFIIDFAKTNKGILFAVGIVLLVIAIAAFSFSAK